MSALEKDPNELHNKIDDPEYVDARNKLYARLFKKLKLDGDNFYHWMGNMYNVGAEITDPQLSSFTAGDGGK